MATEELMRSPGTLALFSAELQKAVISATDSTFIASLISSTTPTPSAGSTLPLILQDMETLLTSVVTGAGSKLFYVASSNNIKSILAKASTAGAPVFPNLGINGGTTFGDIIAVASDQISSSAALLFDATAIVGNSDLIALDGSTQGTLEYETSPDSPPTAATVTQSLWQTNTHALRAERFFGFSILRSNGIASLSSVAY